MASWLRKFLLILLVVPGLAFADPAPFDLAGPKLEVKVTHAGKTLPISEVPNLAAGDQLSIKADLPQGQSAHYLLIAAFLRGATNPPPESWFFSSETWSPKGKGGLKVTVPKDAQQALIFLAPETGGDFKTLIGAVRGRPGAFVRASQDLNQATLDRARLKVYLAAIQKISQSDFEHLKIASPLLARSLAIKFDADCLQKTPELQAPCLMQGREALVLNDGHSTSVVQALTSDTSTDLIAQLSYTPKAGSGYYSPYVASVVDIARIMDSFHTAQYQYIPALATEQGDQLSLELNAVPSFHNPKSVLVVALPAIISPRMPPLHPVDPKQVYCAEKTELVLPAEGAPLVFATAYAHDMVLRLKGKNGKFVDLPVTADAENGGYVANTAGLNASNFGDVLDGSLRGNWGFEPYNGPEFRLQSAHPQHWQLAGDDQQPLIAGHDGAVLLAAQEAACVDSILLQPPTGKPEKAEWKSTKPNEVLVTVPLKKVKPGALTLLVKQFGSKEPDKVSLQAFAQAGHLDSFTLHAGDLIGVLKGNRLGEVKELTLNGVSFKPNPHSVVDDGAEELSLVAADAKAAEGLKDGDSSTAMIALKDGRVLKLETAVAAPRPRVTLIAKSIQPTALNGTGKIQLADQDEIPQNAQLTFSLHAQLPTVFSGDEKIEVATVHGSFLTTLTAANGLTLEDAQVALATLDTGKAFAPSAFGPLRFRLIEKGVASDWQPLATLVRLPVFGDLKCPDSPDQPCKLSGTRLFLVNSISSDPQFAHSIQIPEGFPGYALTVPRPTTGPLYLRLHDDPAVVNSVLFPAEALAQPTIPASASPSKPAPNPAAAGTQSNPSAAATTAVPTAEQGAIAAPLSKPSTVNSAAPAPAAKQTTAPASPQGKPPTPTPKEDSSAGGAPASAGEQKIASPDTLK
jgi:hypothetical protein